MLDVALCDFSMNSRMHACEVPPQPVGFHLITGYHPPQLLASCQLHFVDKRESVGCDR